MKCGVVRNFSILLILIVTVGSCDHLSKKHGAHYHSIKTYKDIPGVTAEEIAAIEVLKTKKDKLSYGAMVGTEAFPLPDGSHDGFTVKFCEHLTELFGIPFVLEIGEWDELIGKLESHSIDFTGELTATEERMKTFFMTLPIAERLHRIFTLVGSERIQTEADIEGTTIAFLEGTVTAETIRKLYHIPFNDIEVRDYPEAAEMLKNGIIDAFVDEAPADPAFENFDFIHSKTFFPMVRSPVSMTTANPELAPIISVIDKGIAAGAADHLFELYRKGDFAYAKDKLRKSLTDEEKAYIRDLADRNASVFVAFEPDNYPVCFYNAREKEYQGIAVEVLDEISRLTDIKFENVVSEDSVWAETFERIKTGEISIAAQLLPTEARKEFFIWCAAPYSRTHYIIMSRLDFPNKASHQIVRYSVGTVRQSGHADVYRALFPNNKNLKEYDSVEECLLALEKGEIDLQMASEHTLVTQLHYREKPDFKINLRLSVPMDSYFGFNKNEAVLCSIVSKAQQFVPIDAIETRWTNRAFDYSKKIAEQWAFQMAIFSGVVSLLLVLAVCLLIRVVRLGKQLKLIANKDALTEIFNRRYFMEQAAIQMERSYRAGSKCYVVIYDLDHFKLVNDKYGHLAGDKVLKETVQRVKSVIRPYDLFARYGGEEFILLLLDVDEKDVMNTVERLRLTICESPVEFEKTSISVSASFGISFVAVPKEIDSATQCADDALYQAKRAGRNRVVFCNHCQSGTVIHTETGVRAPVSTRNNCVH